MDQAQPVGLDHQQCRKGPALAQAVIEPAEGQVPAGRGQHFAAACAADTQDRAFASVTLAGDMAELGHHPVRQPAQQGRAFGIDESGGIGLDGGLHLRPVAYRGAHIGQGRGKLCFQRTAVLRVDAVGLDVDEAFADGSRSVARRQVGQPAIPAPHHRQDRVHQQVHGKAARGHGAADRIDEEGHVAVDHGDAGDALVVGGAADQDGGLAMRPVLRGFEEEGGDLVQRLAGDRRLAGQDRRLDAALQLPCPAHAGGPGLVAYRHHASSRPLWPPSTTREGACHPQMVLGETISAGECFGCQAQGLLAGERIESCPGHDDLICPGALDKAADPLAHRLRRADRPGNA